MSTFDAAAKHAAREMLTETGQAVTYRGEAGDIDTVAVIAESVELFGFETSVGDSRYTCLFLAEDVADARRNDRVTDASGVMWLLQEEQPNSDEWIREWSVTQQ